MSHPRPHPQRGSVGDEIREWFGKDVERPLLIVGNGPSAATPRHDLLPDDPVVLRMNWFFLEDRYHYGRRVDGFFYAIPNERLEHHLARVVTEGSYDIGAVFSPMRVPSGRDGDRYRSALTDLDVVELDHWNAIAEVPQLARYLMSRPLPTQGVQVLAASLAAGFRDITLCGIDLYEPTESRYGYAIPDDVAAALAIKDLTPGYESAHSLDRDLDVIDTCLRLFPDASIRYVGPSRHLTARLPAPAGRGRPCTFDGEPANDVAIAPKATLAVDASGTLATTVGDALPYAEIDGRRCAFVTLVSGPFHHGARALARSLEAVSDVPLLVMCTPSAERAKLRASGLHVIDIGEVSNPNQLTASTERFAATYSKLQAFRMTHLDRAVYVDSDMIVLRPIDDLFRREGFWAVPDHGLDYHYERFNSGLFKFDPDADQFERLVEAATSTASYDGGDQGFLNEVFSEWNPLPHEYNVNKRWSTSHPNLFREAEARVIHFVGRKPWQTEASAPHDELSRRWLTYLTADELAELVTELRVAAVPAPAPRRPSMGRVLASLSGRRSASQQTGWDQGSLLRRAQVRITDGAPHEALDLLRREWPGDQDAGTGLHRELMRSHLLVGDLEGAAERLEVGLALHPSSSTVARGATAIRRADRFDRLTGRLVPRRVWAALFAAAVGS